MHQLALSATGLWGKRSVLSTQPTPTLKNRQLRSPQACVSNNFKIFAETLVESHLDNMIRLPNEGLIAILRNVYDFDNWRAHGDKMTF